MGRISRYFIYTAPKLRSKGGFTSCGVIELSLELLFSILRPIKPQIQVSD